MVASITERADADFRTASRCFEGFTGVRSLPRLHQILSVLNAEFDAISVGDLPVSFEAA